MQVRVLGAAAGGGSPQWNCRCLVCEQVRGAAPGTTPRMQSSIAVRADATSPWLLINASPDVHRQLALLEPADTGAAAADEVRRSPIAAVLLTDAELDHCSGLLLLREQTTPLRVLGTTQVRDALTSDYPIVRMLDDWCTVDWHELTPDDPDARSSELGLEIEAFTTGHDAPRYLRSGAAAQGGPGTSIGVTLRDAAGTAVTYCPTIEAWTPELAARLAASVLVLADGTFWSDDELALRGAGTRTATDMGHLPLGGEQGSAVRLAALDARVVLVHINNTNPILVAGSDERAQLDALGIVVAEDGMEVSEL